MTYPGIPAHRGTPAMRAQAGHLPTAPRRYSQAQMRDRRRKGLLVAKYGATWSLRREIADVTGPLAQRIAALPDPARPMVARPVRALAESTHELVGTVVGWLAEVDAQARTRHLADKPGERRYAIRTLVDLAQRPALVDVTDQALADGSWAAALAAMADDCDARFSALLDKAYGSNAGELRGQRSRTERLVALLRETLDQPAAALDKRITHAEAEPPQANTTSADRARAELESLGVTL